jgi:hypothetical protein
MSIFTKKPMSSPLSPCSENHGGQDFISMSASGTFGQSKNCLVFSTGHHGAQLGPKVQKSVCLLSHVFTWAGGGLELSSPGTQKDGLMSVTKRLNGSSGHSGQPWLLQGWGPAFESSFQVSDTTSGLQGSFWQSAALETWPEPRTQTSACVLGLPAYSRKQPVSRPPSPLPSGP